MISRTSILTTAKAAMEASSGLTGITVIICDGTNFDDIESALNVAGTVIVLYPILRFEPTTQEAGVVSGDVTFAAWVGINPAVNATLTTPKTIDALRDSIIGSLIAIAADDHNDRFKLQSDDSDFNDPGILAATMTFSKGIQINPA